METFKPTCGALYRRTSEMVINLCRVIFRASVSSLLPKLQRSVERCVIETGYWSISTFAVLGEMHVQLPQRLFLLTRDVSLNIHRLFVTHSHCLTLQPTWRRRHGRDVRWVWLSQYEVITAWISGVEGTTDCWQKCRYLTKETTAFRSAQIPLYPSSVKSKKYDPSTPSFLEDGTGFPPLMQHRPLSCLSMVFFRPRQILSC